RVDKDITIDHPEDTEIDIEEEGTYSAGEIAAPAPSAIAPTSAPDQDYQPDFNAQQRPVASTEDTHGPEPSQPNSDNHSHRGVRPGEHDARGERDQASPGAQTADAPDQSHAPEPARVATTAVAS